MDQFRVETKTMLTPAGLQLSNDNPPRLMADNPSNGRLILDWLRDVMREKVIAQLGPGEKEFATTHIWRKPHGVIRLSRGPDWTSFLQFALPNQSWEVMFSFDGNLLATADSWGGNTYFSGVDDLLKTLDSGVQRILSMA